MKKLRDDPFVCTLLALLLAAAVGGMIGLVAAYYFNANPHP